MHIHIRAADLPASVTFYTALFGQPPTVEKADYIKWMLDDPFVNFAITRQVGVLAGIEHIGIEVGDVDTLNDLTCALTSAKQKTRPELNSHCCYAKSEKQWTSDPQGVLWELFHTSGSAETYHRPE